MKLGILKTDAVRPEWASNFGEYPDMFTALLGRVDSSLEFVTYDVEEGEYPGDVDEVDAYLITGSKSSVYDDKPWIATLMDLVRTLDARKKKVVGICFGHQIVAHALGGKTAKSSKGWGVGRHTHRFDAIPAWHDGGESDFDILVSHQDQIVRPTPQEPAPRHSGYAFCPPQAVVTTGTIDDPGPAHTYGLGTPSASPVSPAIPPEAMCYQDAPCQPAPCPFF